MTVHLEVSRFKGISFRNKEHALKAIMINNQYCVKPFSILVISREFNRLIIMFWSVGKEIVILSVSDRYLTTFTWLFGKKTCHCWCYSNSSVILKPPTTLLHPLSPEIASPFSPFQIKFRISLAEEWRSGINISSLAAQNMGSTLLDS